MRTRLLYLFCFVVAGISLIFLITIGSLPVQSVSANCLGCAGGGDAVVGNPGHGNQDTITNGMLQRNGATGQSCLTSADSNSYFPTVNSPLPNKHDTCD
jgi:hypothetical protein